MVNVAESNEAIGKEIYSPTGVIAPWKITPTDGMNIRETPEGIELQFNPFKAGGNEWPRLILSGEGIDLSGYSQLVFELDNLDGNEQSLLIAARSDKENIAGLAGVAGTVGRDGTHRIVLDISDGAPLEQSKVQEIYICLYQPSQPARYRLRKVTAVRNPDFLPRREALGGFLTETQSLLQEYIKSEPAKEERAGDLQQAESTLASATSDFEKRRSGYVTLVVAKLDRAQKLLGKYGMRTRNEALISWHSPLGLAIREGTLPKTSDATLREIQQRVIPGQYLVYAINLSANQEQQSVQVSLNVPEALKSSIYLRPTLWVKARDGSLTADAIGESTHQVDLNIKPFSTEQVFLWVDAKKGTLRPGQVEASVTISKDGASMQEIPVSINVVDLKIPADVPLLLTNWAYFYTDNVKHTNGLEVEARDNLRDYGMNTWVLNYRQVPLPSIGSDGKYQGLEKDSLASFHQVMKLLQGKPQENFIIWLGFHRPEFPLMLEKPEVLEKYLHDLHALLDQYGVQKDRRYIKLWDEPNSVQVRETARWMSRIREYDSSFLFFDNSSHLPEGRDELDAYLGAVDVWLPNWEALFKTRPDEVKRAYDHGVKRVGFYRCLMSRNNRGVNIYEYYRMLGWHLMQGGFDSLAFWVYNVGVEDLWDGTLGSASGGQVAYAKDGKLLSSRRWEMVREAIDDYRLAMVAIGEEGRLDPKSHPELKKWSQEVISKADKPGFADQMRERLIDSALQKKQK